MISFKRGVRLHGLKPQIAAILTLCDGVYARHNVVDCVVTSINDGYHIPKSRHYRGEAVDLRVHNIPKQLRIQVVEEIRRALPMDFDIILESIDTPNEHIHIEWDPK